MEDTVRTKVKYHPKRNIDAHILQSFQPRYWHPYLSGQSARVCVKFESDNAKCEAVIRAWEWSTYNAESVLPSVLSCEIWSANYG